jgi:D-alanine transaminase
MNDRLVAWAEAVVPVEDRGLQLGESLYEVVPVTAGQPRLLAAHAARLAGGAAELDLESGAPDVEQWHRIAETLIAREAVDEGLLYVQLTGGAAPRDHLQTARPRPTLIAYLRRHRFPRRDRVDGGLRAITIADTRWARCDLKTTMLLPAVLAKREAAAHNADEAILVAPDGSIREGASTSLLAVVDGALVSPEPSQHLLPGTMSTLVTEAADEAGITTAFRTLDLADLRGADEILLSATSKLVLPVLELDGRPVGDGAAGPVAHELADRIRRRLSLDDT